MPSGSRKRKAAKKKQEKVVPKHSLSAASSTQGDEDVKRHESDGDQNTDGEEGVEKLTADGKNGDVQGEKAAGQDDGGVQVKAKSNEKKGDLSSSSSNSSSSDSDDGPREAEKKIEIEENAPVDDSVAEAVSVSDGPIEVIHTTPGAKTEDPLAECVSEVGEGKNVLLDEKVPTHSGASADSPISPDVVELEQKENGEAKFSSGELPEATKDLAPEDKDKENASPLEVAKELAPDEESVRLSEVTTTELAPEDKDGENVSPLEVGKELVPDEQSARLPEVATEVASEDKDEETISPLKVAKELVTGDRKYENIDVAATSDATESAVSKNEEKLTLSYSAKRVDTTEDSGHSQACATSVVRADQSTSWKSCCGLFEALTGTSR